MYDPPASHCSCPLPETHHGSGGFHFRPLRRRDLERLWPEPPGGSTEQHAQFLADLLTRQLRSPQSGATAYETCPAYLRAWREGRQERQEKATQEQRRRSGRPRLKGL